jgi:hypothetical protein
MCEVKKTDEFYQFTHVSPRKDTYIGIVPCSVFPSLVPDFWVGHEKFAGFLVNQTPSIMYTQMYINDIFFWVSIISYKQLIVYNTLSGSQRVVEFNIYLFPENVKQTPFITHCVKWI